VTILRELDYDYARIASGQFGAVADEWEEHGTTIGQEVIIRNGATAKFGAAPNHWVKMALLLLRTEHGHLERVIGGDVTVEK